MILSSVQNFNKADEKSCLNNPILFGVYSGMYFKDIPVSYWTKMARLSNTRCDIKAAKLFKKISQVPAKVETVKISLPKDLWVWQVKAIKKLLNSHIGAIFSPAGSGKTRMFLEMLKIRWKLNDKLLVVCPLSVYYSFQDEVLAITPDLSSIVCDEKKEAKLSLVRDVYFINYHSFLNVSVVKALKKIGFTYILLDESHNIKSEKIFLDKENKSLGFTIAENVRQFCQDIPNRFLFTGTPMDKTLLEIWSQFFCLDGGDTLYDNFYQYRNKYFHKYGPWQWKPNPSTNGTIKNLIKKFTILVRPEDLPDLPSVHCINVKLIMNGKQAKAYKDILEDRLATIDIEDGVETDIEALFKIVEIGKLHQIGGGTVRYKEDLEELGDDLMFRELTTKPHVFKDSVKINWIKDFVPNIQGQFVIVAYYRAEIDLIKATLKKLKVSFSEITGNVKPKQREIEKKRFIWGRTKGCILQPQSAGTGLDGLQYAQPTIIINYTRPWSRTLDHQTFKRVHRGGLKVSVTLYNLIAWYGNHSLDNLVKIAIGKKEKTIEEFMS